MKRLTAREIESLEKRDGYSKVVRHRKLSRDTGYREEAVGLAVREMRVLDGHRGLRTLALSAIGALPPVVRNHFLEGLDDVNWREHEPGRTFIASNVGVPLGSLGRFWAIDILRELDRGPRAVQDILGADVGKRSVRGRQLRRLEREGSVVRWVEGTKELVGLTPDEERQRAVLGLPGNTD